MASKKGAAASIKWVALLQTNWGVISSVKEHFAVLPIFLTLYRHLFFLTSCPDAHRIFYLREAFISKQCILLNIVQMAFDRPPSFWTCMLQILLNNF